MPTPHPDSTKDDAHQQIYLDPFLVDRLRINQGWSRKELAGKAKIAFNTLTAMFRESSVQPSTAHVIAKVLGKQVTDLLSPRDPRYVLTTTQAPQHGTNEWEAVAYLEDGRLASNGLYYLVCKMQHRHTAGRLGRGKYYHLSWLPAARRAEIQHQLSRHSEVCTRLGPLRSIATNYSSQPAGSEGWWVVDEWVGEKTLANHMHDRTWSISALPQLLLDVAESLHVMHHAGIVFRELAPARVQIAEKDGRAVVTDFELAKLLDGSPTVSSEWPEDPFRAPEVDGGACTPRSDLYSFGKLTLAAIGCDVQASHDDQLAAFSRLTETGASKRLVKLLQQCIEPLDSRRPVDMQPILQELCRWMSAKNSTARKA